VGEESKANVLPAQLNQMTAVIRMYVVLIAWAASRIHCDFDAPDGSLGVASALAHSASIIGFEESAASREYTCVASNPWLSEAQPPPAAPQLKMSIAILSTYASPG
jgi:hypothetical protein